METTSATGSDVGVLPQVRRNPARRGVPPAEHLVDASYVAVGQLVASREQGIDLVGPAGADIHWQARDGQGYDATQFRIDWAGTAVTCPHGQRRVRWRAAQDRQQRPIMQVDFAKAACLPCPTRTLCTCAGVNPRSLTRRTQVE